MSMRVMVLAGRAATAAAGLLEVKPPKLWTNRRMLEKDGEI